MGWLAIVVLTAVSALCMAWIARRWRAMRTAAELRAATRDFVERRSEYTPRFLSVAAASGKPRGLAWESCEFHEGVCFAVDRSQVQLYALVGVTIRFSATPGGPMEDVEAVANLRCATAVFVFRNGEWSTDGRVLFNLEPHEALAHFGAQVESFAGGLDR